MSTHFCSITLCAVTTSGACARLAAPNLNSGLFSHQPEFRELLFSFSQMSGFLALCIQLFFESRDSSPTTLFFPRGRQLAVLTLFLVTSLPPIRTVIKSLRFPTISLLRTPGSISPYRHPAQVIIHLPLADCFGICPGYPFFYFSPSPMCQPMEWSPDHHSDHAPALFKILRWDLLRVRSFWVLCSFISHCTHAPCCAGQTWFHSG